MKFYALIISVFLSVGCLFAGKPDSVLSDEIKGKTYGL